MAAKVREAWSFEVGRLKVSGDRRPADKVTIEVTELGDGPPTDPGEITVETEIGADDWREIVAGVEARLIQRGDPQR